jgi:hypothetical protein
MQNWSRFPHFRRTISAHCVSAIDDALRLLAYLVVVNTGMIGRDQYQIELRDYRLIRLIFSQPVDCLRVSIQCVCHSVRCTTYSGMAVLLSPANSLKWRIFPYSRECCHVAFQASGIAARLLTGLMAVENKHGSSKCSFVLNRLSSSLRCRSKSQHAYTDAFAYTVMRPELCYWSRRLQNRMCSDIAVTSKVEILDTSFLARTPARSGHWK